MYNVWLFVVRKEESRDQAFKDGLKAVMQPKIKQDGDLFSLGLKVATDDVRATLEICGCELSDFEMHEVMRTVIFHIKR